MERRPLLLLVSVLLVACGGGEGDGTVEDSAALTAQQCKAPEVSNSAKLDAAGRPIAGNAHTTIRGCIVGKNGESGSALFGRATALLNDTAMFATLKDEAGAPVFKRFVPGPTSGSLTQGLHQDVDVALNLAFTPTTRIRVSRQDLGGGRYKLSVTNLTVLKATIAILPVTVVAPQNLRAEVELRTDGNGITVTGSTDVQLEAEKDRATESAQLARQLFDWMVAQLA